jgi:hypothetical protein
MGVWLMGITPAPSKKSLETVQGAGNGVERKISKVCFFVFFLTVTVINYAKRCKYVIENLSHDSKNKTLT